MRSNKPVMAPKRTKKCIREYLLYSKIGLYQVGNLISQDIITVNKVSDWQITNLGMVVLTHHSEWFRILKAMKLKFILIVTYLITDLHQVTTALDNRRREEKESVEPVMRQLEAQTQSFQAMTERLSSNIMADFEVMLQKQLSSSIEG